jgi:hypothetical protein
MDTDKIITTAKSRFAHEANRRVLKEKYEAKMLFAHAGGMWRAGPELLNILHICKDTDPLVILDLYDNPVQVNAQELFDLAQQRWQEQMTAWLIELDNSRKQR